MPATNTGPSIHFGKGDICVVVLGKEGPAYFPVLPGRKGDNATCLKEGTLLKNLGDKEIQPGAYFYEMEVITGPKAGNTVWIPLTIGNSFLEIVPSRNYKR